MAIDPETGAVLGFVVAGGLAALLMLLVRQFINLAPTVPDEQSWVRLRLEVPTPPAAHPAAESLDRSLEQLTLGAGLNWHPLVSFLFIACSGTLAGGLVFLRWDDPLAAGLGAISGMSAACVVFIVLRDRRRRKLRDQLPTTAEMLARAVRAGESIEQALLSIAQRTPAPLGAELGRAVRQVSLGLPVATALRVLGSRSRIVDLQLFAAALVVHRQTGGQLAVALDRMAAMLRARARYRQRIRSVTASGRLATLFTAAAGPLLIAYFMYDEKYAHSLFYTDGGRMWLAVSAGLELVGLIWVASLLRIET